VLPNTLVGTEAPLVVPNELLRVVAALFAALLPPKPPKPVEPNALPAEGAGVGTAVFAVAAGAEGVVDELEVAKKLNLGADVDEGPELASAGLVSEAAAARTAGAAATPNEKGLLIELAAGAA